VKRDVKRNVKRDVKQREYGVKKDVRRREGSCHALHDVPRYPTTLFTSLFTVVFTVVFTSLKLQPILTVRYVLCI